MFVDVSLLNVCVCYICLHFCPYWPAQPDDPSTIRVASVIAFSVLCLFSVTFFLILLQYNIWPPHTNCNVCDLEFALRVNLRRHDTAMYVMPIFIEIKDTKTYTEQTPEVSPCHLYNMTLHMRVSSINA